VAIVCNGPQMAIFQAITIGQEPLKGECYLFNGFQDYLSRFNLLWTLLSPEGIVENRALSELSRHRNPRLPTKCSSSIPEPNKHRYRDSLQNELRDIGSFLLEEIEDNPELRADFYRECYVPIEANNRHLLLSKQIIASRYNRVSGDNVAPSALDTASSSGRLSPSFLRNAGSKPIVVVGDVGVGKTSFFENLFLHLDDASDSYIVTVNLGTNANLTDDLKEYILDSIPEALYHDYGIDIESSEFVRTTYYDEIARWEKSVGAEQANNDPVAHSLARSRFLVGKTEKKDRHLHAALSHIAKGQKRRLILVIDNADQRSSEIQQQAFLIAQELAATRNLFVFVSLRPSTFYQSKVSGTLAAYQNKILTISPPPADIVIERRLSFALRVAEGKVAPAALDDIRLNLTSIVAYLKSTLRSVRVNADIRQFLGNITGGNTRGVIEMITTFCGSPNVDARKIVDIETSTNNYVVPLHEFTKHALLGEYSYYNPNSSVVACNVFDVSAADPREHFLQPLIVAYLSSSIGGRDQDGFVTGEAVAGEMARCGFLTDQIEFSLKRLAAKKLIETPYSHFREIAVPDNISPKDFHFRATSVGIYHVRFWLGSFSFLDAVSTDTPILDEGIRHTISKLASSFDIGDRYKKAKAFRDYLQAKWHLSNLNVGYFDFPAILAGNEEQFASVERVLNRTRIKAAQGAAYRS
jgi:GTPase SAR1 family protein